MQHLPTGTVTLLFTDIEGSTHLLQRLGGRYPNVLAEYRSLLRTVFHTYYGHEVDTQGDSFFVAFAHATDAVSAVVEMQRTLAAHTWPNGVTIPTRIGLHTGEPQLSAEGYVGLDVHLAARVMSAGHGGQVLLSQTTRDLVMHNLPEGVILQDLGVYRLKGLQYPTPFFQLVIMGLPAVFPQLRTLDTHFHNLPVQPTTFVGREQVVANGLGLLRREDVRLLTLIGPGGIGKTRLSLQVAAELSDRFTDGVYFVNLAPISNLALVIPTIASTLDLKEIAGQSILDLLKSFLREKRLLLLLDNFEQVVKAAVQVAELLPVCPNLKIMVTSRMALHVRAEHEFPVPPLTLPDPKHMPDFVSLSQCEAVALFFARAQTIKPEFQLTSANVSTVTEICKRLDGLPLAIELAAARIKLLPPQALLARMGQRLAVLTSVTQDVPTRQQTLRNTIKWSYDLLNAEEQRLFRRLSVFVGGCTLEALETVCSTSGAGTLEVLDGVASLLDKSLLRQSEHEEGEPRFTMLETIREYGLEELATSGEMKAIQQAYADYYLNLAEMAATEIRGSGQVMRLKQLLQEYDNLRTALRWLIKENAWEVALRLCIALADFWLMQGYDLEGYQWFRRALKHSDKVMITVRAKAFSAAGYLAQSQHNIDQAEVLGRESLALFQELEDRKGIAESLLQLGGVLSAQGDYIKARTLYEQCLTISREMGDSVGVADALLQLGGLLFYQGDYTKSRAAREESLVIYRSIDDKAGIANTLSLLAQSLSLQGEHIKAYALAQESLEIARESGFGSILEFSIYTLGVVAIHQGNYIAAKTLLKESLMQFNELDDKGAFAWQLYSLAELAYLQGDYDAARTYYENGLTLSNNRGFVAFSMEGLAAVIAAQGELTWATRLWGANETLRQTIGILRPPFEQVNYESAVTKTRDRLGEQAFASAWAEGRTMTPEQVLAAQGKGIIVTPTPIEPTTIPLAKSHPSYPDGLTVREAEVLQLVAQGLTNDQVAEQLVISPRTVNTHLTSIYGKIGVSSRSAATRYAMEHHLI